MIPFIVAVTGHRDLSVESIPTVAEAVRDVLLRYKDLMVNTEVVVVSALAEGADRLVAQTALACNCKLWVLLPTEPKEYVKDFSSEESISEFKQLMECASEVINVPLKLGKAHNFHARPEIYVDTALVLGSLANLLVAVWDGNQEEKPGGTSQVVRLFRSGEYCIDNTSTINQPSGGPVVHIACARAGNVGIKVSTRWLSNYKEPDQLIKEVDPFDRDQSIFGESLTMLDRLNGRLNQSTPNRIDRQDQKPTTDPKANTADSRWTILFDRMDYVSGAAQRYRVKNLIWIMLSFVLFNLATLAYDGIAYGPLPLLIGTLFLLVATLFYFIQRIKRTDEFWVGSRAIAEFLRISLALISVGGKALNPKKLIEEGLDRYDWITISWKSIHSLSFLTSSRVDISEIEQRARLSEWCNGQVSYFEGQTSKILYHSKMAKRYQMTSAVAVIIALTVYLSILAFEILYSTQESEQFRQVSTWAIYVYWSLLSIGAVSASVSYASGHNEHSDNYRDAATKFRIAIDKLSTAEGIMLHEIAGHLTDAAFRECIAWLKLHRARPIKLPF